MRLFVVLVVAALLLIVPTSAHGCYCASPSDAAGHAAADVVFTGTAVARHDPQGEGPLVSSGRPVTTTFEVAGVAKGHDIAASKLDVEAAADGASCGFDFRLGARYRVFATADADGLSTDLCSGTRPLAAGEAIDGAAPEVGPPAAPGPTAAPPLERLWPVLLAIVAAGAIVLVAARLPRRR